MFHGMSKNISKPMIGRISRGFVSPNKRDRTIIVNPHMSFNEMKCYCALFLSDLKSFERAKDVGIPIVFFDKDIDSLINGDVVEIFPDGKINVLYQIKSRHNIIFATSKCNSKCVMCPQPVDLTEGDMTDNNLELISLIDKSANELAITGGEPTVIGKDLFRLILACKEFLPDTSLLLLTNARRFSDYNYTHFFSSIRHPNMTVGIALYGDNDIEHDFIAGSTGAFNETVRGILNLATFGNQIEIRTVIHKYTYKNLTRIAEYAYRNMTFVRHVAIMGMETIGLAKDNLLSLWIEPSEMLDPLEESIHYLRQRGMNVSIYNIPLCLLPERLWKFARQSISDWKNSFGMKCFECSVREKCSGMFESGMDIYDKYIKPIN